MTLPRELVLWIGIAVVCLGGVLLMVVALITQMNARRRFRTRVAQVVGTSATAPSKSLEIASPTNAAMRDGSGSFLDPILTRLLGRQLMPRWLTRGNRLFTSR